MERAPRDILFSWAQVVSGSVALFTALSLFASVFLLGELVVHFKVFYLLGALVSAGAFAVRRKWRWLLFAGVLAAVHVPGVLAWYLPASDPLSEGAVTNLRIVTANVLTKNQEHGSFLDFIEDTQPDIVFIQELNDAWAESLQALKEVYAHYAMEPRSDNFGIAMFSRLPLEEIDIRYYGEGSVPSVHARLTLDGRSISLLSYHTLPPAGREYLATRNRQLEAIGAYVEAQDDLVIVAGDLNVTPWSPSYKRMIRASGLKNARRGYGIKPTWTGVPLPVPLLPLDHVLLSPGIAVKTFGVGPRIGSDHRPLVVALVVPPPSPLAGLGMTAGPIPMPPVKAPIDRRGALQSRRNAHR